MAPDPKSIAPVESSPPQWEELEEFKPVARPPRRSWLAGNRSLLIGLAAGMAIAIAGMSIFSAVSSRPRSTPATPAATTNAPGQSVTVATAQQAAVTQQIAVTGTVAARDLLPILPEVSGLQVQQVLATEGNTVRAGQALAVLNSTVLQAQLNEAQANVTSAQAQVRQKQAALGEAQANAANANANLQRYRSLVEAGASSQQELQSRETTAATAQSQVQVAQADISSAQAGVQSSVAQVQRLQTQIAQTVVRAPSDGVIAEAPARVGDVTGAQKLFSIIRGGAIELDAQVTADQLAQVRVGAIVQVTADSDSRIRVQGRVREIAPLVNEQTRQGLVKIDLPANPLLRPGLFLRAAISTTTQQGLVIPAKAILPRSGGQLEVFVLEGDVVRARSIEVGARQTDPADPTNATVEVRQGLKLGDRVVVDGAGYLKDGDRVRVVEGRS